jgi:predicted metalloendopeptidase
MNGADFRQLEESYDSLDEVKFYTSAVMQAMGYDKDAADEMGQQVGYYVMDIYNATDTEQFYSLMTAENFKLYTREQIEAILTNVDINAYYNEIGIDISGVQEFGIYDPGQLQALNDSFVEENLEVLKMIELCNFIRVYEDYIYPSYDTLRQYAEENVNTPEDRAIDVILQRYAQQTDPLYVERYYNEEMDQALISMCDDIRESYRTLISGAEWLSESTRQGLLQKLDNIIYITGMDVHRADPSIYAGLECENYYQYTLGLNRIKTQELIEHFFDPVDRGAVVMSMQAMNAAYSPSNNSISITAAIMRAPFFDVNADYYANLGGLGMVIAHEMGHAFDSKNINYDANGVFNPLWVGEEDRAALDERDQAAVEYFENNFTIFGVYHVDGERTLGENFADLGGVECISLIPQTNEERRIMYENFARVWCAKVLDTGLVSQLASDVHSPGYIRVMAVLSSIDQFYEAYGVTEGDGMYLPPEERISRWY